MSKSRYYFNNHLYSHFADLCTAYHAARGHYPMTALKRKDSKGNWILVYK